MRRKPHHLLSALVIFLASLPALAGGSSAADAGWQPIPLVKDGKIADDWVHVGWGGFEVVNGNQIRTAPDPRMLGLLVYKGKKLGDCQVRVVFKPEKPKSNSGVYVRIDDGVLKEVGKTPIAVKREADGSLSKEEVEKMKKASDTEDGAWYAVHHGFEVQIADNGDAAHRTGAIYSLAKAAELPRVKEDGWRTMIITLRGTKVEVEVDGKTVSSFDSEQAESARATRNWTEPKLDSKRPKAGYIGLQNHDPGDVVTFKEVSVRPLDSK
jgi:hypothetical protein